MARPARTVDWNLCAALPQAARAALCALRFDSASPLEFKRMAAGEWREFLSYCDRMKITLAVADRCRERFPEWVRSRTDRDLENNLRRYERQWAAFDEIDSAFRGANVEYLLLKGFTHGADYISPAYLRQQCDLDLFQPKASLRKARRVLEELGYQTMGAAGRSPMDHLPAMVRKSSYEWRGDYFDPHVPLAVELHFQWWDSRTERLPATGLERFWERRLPIEANGRTLSALAPQDRITYAALHALRHLLRGDARAFQLYEIGSFLHKRAEDDAFWSVWAGLNAPEIRRYAATVFEIARLWFGCALSEGLQAEIGELSEGVRRWHQDYATAPLESLYRPNKAELWLHLALLPAGAPRWPVVVRRILPRTLPTPVAGVFTPRRLKGPLRRLKEAAQNGAHLARRMRHHLAALFDLGRELYRRRSTGIRLGTGYWIYLAAASLHHLGAFIFVLLYNLHLRDLGFDEAFLGLISSSMTVGGIAGAIPGGWLAQRFGLRRALLVCLLAIPAVAVFRTVVYTEALLAASAFVAGVFFSLWVVCIAPVVAGLVPEGARTRAFSVFFASSIAMGVLGGLLGGRLLAWLESAGLAGPSALQASILAGCGVMATALLPGGFVRQLPKLQAASLSYPRGPFIKRFLGVVFLWNLATGAFNPFFNVYFAERLRVSVRDVGDLFAAAQLAQVAAVLVAPLLLERLGRVQAIAALQGAAGLALLLMAAREPLWIPCGAYLLYMSFQWMSEPGLHSLLMSKVDEAERTAASSLTYTTMFTAHAVAAGAAGLAISRVDYFAVLVSAGGLAMLSGILFRANLGRFGGSSDTKLAESLPCQASR